MSSLRGNQCYHNRKEHRHSLSYRSPRPKDHLDPFQNRRASSGEISDAASAQASLTVEAALSLTLFLLAVTCFWGLFPAIQMGVEIQWALEQTTEEMAISAYGAGKWTEKISGAWEKEGAGAEELLSAAAGGLSLEYARQRVIQLVGVERLEASCILGGSSGLSFLGSSVEGEDLVDLQVSYQVRLPFPVGGSGVLSLSQRSCRRTWTGVLAEGGGAGEEDAGQLVYVAEHGSVYHTTLDCTYLRLSVTAVSYAGVKERRNQWGSRYTPCERCAKYAEETPVVWITGEGRRYHTDRDCGGLTRTVETVPLAETGLPPCSRCGGGDT